MDIKKLQSNKVIASGAVAIITAVCAIAQVGDARDVDSFTPSIPEPVTQLIVAEAAEQASEEAPLDEVTIPSEDADASAVDAPGSITLPARTQYAIQLCDSGHPNACLHVAELYAARETRGFAEARGYFGKACDIGVSSACLNLGAMHQEGYGGPVNLARAAEAYTRSCHATGIDGCNALAGLHRDGNGIPQDFRSALVLFKKTCDDDDAEGCFGLAAMNEAGQGTKVDKLLAHYLYRRACKLENEEACRRARG